MIPENFKTLVDKLTEKTTKKEAIWYKTSGYNEFKLDLGKGAITVDRWGNEMSGDGMVDLTIINEYGDTVDSVSFSNLDKQDYKYLVDFHSLVQRTHNKVDEIFKTIFEELDSNKTVGTEKKVDNLPPW